MTNEEHSVWEAIQVFLNRRAQNSQNTADTYERAIRAFFMETRNKRLEDLVPTDLVFSQARIEAYQVSLKDKYKSNTVNTYMYALKSLYEKLQAYKFPVQGSWFDLDKYDDSDSKPSDPMEHSEVVEAIRILLKTREGKQKALLIRLAYATAFRKESLLEMKKTDIFNRNGIWFVKVLGKGNKWDSKKISTDLHRELMERCAVAKSDKIFTLTDKTVNRMMNEIRSQIDFGERKITFHSLKKSSVEEVRLITDNDVKAMQEHAGHSDPSVTLKSYTSSRKLDDLVMVDINQHIPLDAFQALSHEELLALVMGMDRNTQIKMLQKMGKF